MKLWAVSMVRNEADIIEAFVRHNLAFLDGLAVLDHGSTDETFEILSRLNAEGLRVARLRTSDAAFFQGSRITALARECFERTDADFVFALDADEFIRSSSRSVVERVLTEVPPTVYPVHQWRTYVPTSFEPPFGPHCLRFRLREEPIARSKVIIPRSFLERTHEMVSEGNHWIADTRTQTRAPYEHIAPDALSLAHCPIRSARQLESKVRLGYQAMLAGGSPRATMGSHWREISEDLAHGIALTDARLRLIASNYAVPRPDWVTEEGIDLVEDPVELRAVRGHGLPPNWDQAIPMGGA
jgi:hypothetical protein